MTLTTTPQTTELAWGMREAAVACVDVLREVVSGLDPDVLLGQEAPEVWSLFDTGEKLCAAAKVLVSRRVEESGVWKQAGMRSAAEYLALRGGTTRNVARDALKTSGRVTSLPQVQDALRRGDLSAAQAHVIADAAAHAPAAQSALLDHAKVASYKELKDECLRRKAAADPKPEDTRDRIYKDRRFRLSTDPEGAWCFSGRGPLDHAGTFNATLNPLIDDEFHKARVEGRREERQTLAYDALREMVRLARCAYYGDDPYDDEDDYDEGDHGYDEDLDEDVEGLNDDGDNYQHPATGHDAGSPQDTAHPRDAQPSRRSAAADADADDANRPAQDTGPHDANPEGEDDLDDEDYPYCASTSGYLFDDLWDDDLHDDTDDEEHAYPDPYSGTGDARDPPGQAT